MAAPIHQPCMSNQTSTWQGCRPVIQGRCDAAPAQHGLGGYSPVKAGCPGQVAAVDPKKGVAHGPTRPYPLFPAQFGLAGFEVEIPGEPLKREQAKCQTRQQQANKRFRQDQAGSDPGAPEAKLPLSLHHSP